jgi:predicted transcriptional regulator of viral defense system
MKYGLGGLESRLIFTLEEQGRTHFTVDDAREILDATDETLWKILHKLTEKRRIQRIKRGDYLLIPARAGYETKWREEVPGFIDGMLQGESYYIGYWTALNLWHMTTQIPLRVFVATTKRRREIIYDGTVPIQFITLKSSKFFGWTTMGMKGKSFKISDPEKTIIDSLDLPQYSGGIVEVATALKHPLDPKKLAEYADRLGNRTVHKRLGYLAELLEIGIPEGIITSLQDKISSGYSWLDPTAPKKVHEYDNRWRLKINMPSKNIRSSN